MNHAQELSLHTVRHNRHKLGNRSLHLELWHTPDHSVTWLPIPKNGYSVVKEVVSTNNWQMSYWHGDSLIQGQSFCVIRNPITRLFTGLREFYSRTEDPVLGVLNWPDMLDAFYQEPQLFDEHCEPQCFYLHGFRPTRWIRYNSMASNLAQWSRFPPNKIINQQSANTSKAGDLWNLYCKYQPQANRILASHWKCDMDLWHNPLGEVDNLL